MLSIDYPVDYTLPYAQWVGAFGCRREVVGIKNARAPLTARSTSFERQIAFKLAGAQKADWSSLAHSALPNSHRLAPTLIDFDAGPLRANAMANEPWVTAGQVAQHRAWPRTPFIAGGSVRACQRTV